MRKAIKKPLTTRGLQLMIKKLNNITTETNKQIEILNNSIMNNWQGIYELKEDSVIEKNKAKSKKEYNQYSQRDYADYSNIYANNLKGE